MALPIRTTLADVVAVCTYLVSKPTGASIAEARAVLDSKVLDGRKLSAMRFWGLIDDTSGKILITDRGRLIVRNKGAHSSEAYRSIVDDTAPYKAIIERAVHRSEMSLSATDVASHWHQHFKSEASSNDKILNDQAVCFFQIAEGADLGRLVVGRKGQSTRFEFDTENAKRSTEGRRTSIHAEVITDLSNKEDLLNNDSEELIKPFVVSDVTKNRVFITHGQNQKILDQVKELVAYGKFEAVVAQERETAAKPVPDKVMDDMRSCSAAVIHIGSEGFLFTEEGKQIPQINGNVLIEIGAAMALYARNFILLVEEGVILPSNLQGLYECRYSGDELNMTATMKLLKAFNQFK